MVKQVIIVRKDLNMRKGKMCAQVAHASLKVLIDGGSTVDLLSKSEHSWKLFGFRYKPDDAWDKWLNGSFTKVVVGCDNRDELFDLYRQAVEADLPCAMITDAGRTEFHGEPTETTVAIGPAEEEEINKITGHLKLL